MATTFTAFSKKAIFVLLFLLLNILSNFAQKGPSKPTNPKKPISSALNCPLVLSIQDNNPTAECSELLKTLVAITAPCTDTTAVSYEWSSSIGGVFSTSRTTTFNLPEFIVATPLTINVIVTEGIDTQSASYTFTIKPRPSRPTISLVGALILCDNNPITLTTTGCVGGSTPIWSNGNAGLSSISVPAVGGTFYKVACEKNGCVSDSTAAVSLVTGIVTPAPNVTNRTICEGTTITVGNGLLADIPNCGTGATGTYTYAGPLVGYDDGYTSAGGIDPSVAVPTNSNIIKKLSVSITWRKQKGGFQNSCGVGDTESYPYHSETQFRIKSPSGKIINLVNTYTYGGTDNPTVTTVFEDGANPVNFYSPPVSGTFSPAQPLSGFIGENPSGTWTLLPYDAVWKDPLCVSGFSITFTADQGGEVTWWDAPTGGNLLHTGAEFIPTATTSGTNTYYAQGQCVKGCPSIRTATTLTINPRPAAPVIDINVPENGGIRSICGGQPITLTATGCANDATVKWSSSQNGANFATGASYTFTPIFSNSSDINQTFTAVCTGVNLCNSLVSNTITLNVKRKPSTPTISGPGSTACINSNITLFASACSGGTLGWTGNRSGSSITFPITTNVDIKVACTVNGCTSDSSSVYSISTLPKPPVPTVNASQVQAICIGGSVTLTANGCINGGTVKWTGGLTGASIILTPTTSKSYRASCLAVNGCASDSSAVLNIVVLPKTKPIITGPTFVCNDSPITLSATGCSGANETVMWRDQSVGLTYSDFITQTKTFRAVCIRNGYCISDSSDVFTVEYRTKPLQPTISAPPNTTVCQGTSLTLTASACVGGISNWTGGLTGNSINITTVGTKLFKMACTINGCTSDSSVAVSVTVKPKPGIPTISSSGNIVCEGQNVTLTASACVGGTLSWTGGLTGQSIVITNVGLRSYKVACTINGCASDSSLVNAVQIKPKPAIPTISANPSTTVCHGTTVTLYASACAGGTLNWTGGLTGNSIFITTVGSKNYKVACTVNGCRSDSSAAVLVTVNPVPIISLTTNKSEICAGENATLTVSGCTGTISWSNGAGNVASINVSPTIATNYIATCTLGSCSSTQQTTITPLQTPRVTASGPLVCDQSITLTAENYPVGATIQWRKDGVDIVGATNNTLVVNEPGNYDFVVGVMVSTIFDITYPDFDPLNEQQIRSIKMITPKIIYISKGNTIQKTLDGGSTWNIIYSGNKFSKIIFPTENLGWCFTSQKIIKTVNGGNTWTTFDITIPNFYIKSASFSNNLNGIVLSTDKRTLYTTDGGNTWNLNSSLISNDSQIGISDIEYVPNSNKIFAISESNLIQGSTYLSTNGGQSWVFNLGTQSNLYDIQFINQNDGFIIGSVPVIGSNTNKIFVTNNGGNNWSEKNILIGQPATIDFISSQVGYAFGLSNIQKTVDGGNNWSIYRSIAIDDNQGTFNGLTNNMDFLTEDNGLYTFISEYQNPVRMVLKKVSTPLCTTKPITISQPSNQASAITLSANRIDLCAGESSTITTTACNGTLSWSNGAGNINSITVSPTISTIYTVTCTSGTCTKTAQITITPLQTPRVTASGPLVCDQSIILTAENYPVGSTIQWRKDGVEIVGATNTTLVVNEAGNYDFVVGSLIELKKQVLKNNYNIKFLNKNIGFLSSNKIEKTIDGGNSWETKYTLINDAFTEITFIDNTHGWAVSYSKILRTIDGGNNWIEYDMTSWGLAPSKISFMDTSNGIVIFYGGKTAYTTDGGITWHLNSNIATTFNTIGIEYKNNVIICVSDFTWSGGGGGRVRKSMDKGLTWEIVKDIFLPCFSFKMVDNNLGFIGTYYGLFKTTDSGNTWIENTIPGSNWIRSISFINNQTGYLIDYDKIYKTTNGGGLWEIYKSFPRDYNLHNQVDQKIEFIDENNGYFIQNAIDPNYIIQDYYIQLFKISTPQCPTTAAIVSPIPRPAGALVINTFKSGAWTDAGTWNCGFIPSLLDEVIINAGHTITDSGNLIQAKKVTFNGNGILQIAPTTNLKLGN